MPVEKFERFLQKEPFQVVFSGGEPLLSDNLFSYAKMCKQKGVKASLISNGTYIDESNVQIIKQLFEGVQISLQAGNAQIHDSIAQNQGSFSRAVNGISLLIDCGVQFSVNLTLTKLNSNDLAETIAELRRLGVLNISITRFCNSTSEYSSSLELGRDEFKEKVYLIDQECKKSGIKFNGIYSGIPMCIFKNKVDFNVRGCSCGHSWVTITPSGGVKPCPAYDQVIGDVDDLDIIWNEGFFKSWRNYEFIPNECQTCSSVESCRGGCRTAAYNRFGDIKSVDPLYA